MKEILSEEIRQMLLIVSVDAMHPTDSLLWDFSIHIDTANLCFCSMYINIIQDDWHMVLLCVL